MSLKGLASIAKGLSAEPAPELIAELDSPPNHQPQPIVAPKKLKEKLAKTRDPDYKRVMVLVKKSTEKKAYRKWEDTNPDKDFSDLVEALLDRYAAGQIPV